MKRFRDNNTGCILTEDDVKSLYREFYSEEHSSFSEYLTHMLDLGKDKEDGFVEIRVRTGKSYSFKYDDIRFKFTLTDKFCECYANNHFQFGFDLGQRGYEENEDDIIEMLINNYENGNIYIGD